MRLKRFEIRNYKAIREVSLEWDDLLVLIGENNSGKSSVLAALAGFLGGGSVKDASVFHRHQTNAADAIEFIGHFDQLSAEEEQQVAVRRRMSNGQWVLKKSYWFEAEDPDNSTRGEWKEQLFSFSSQETFTGWPSPDATWAAFGPEYQPLIQQLRDRPARPNAAARDALRELLRVQRPDLVTMAAPEWVPNPGGGGNWKSNANSILPRAIFVRAVHEASDETNSKEASTYGKLINLIVERQLAGRREIVELKRSLDAVLQLFRPDPEHPERQAEEVRALQARINMGLSEVIGGEALIKTEPPEVQSLVMPSTSLVIKDPVAGIETQVGHQGHGLQRTLVMTLLQLLAEVQAVSATPGADQSTRSTVLLVEEPELYLHPQMARLMRDVLYRLASSSGMQVACCTHSPVFLDVAEKYRAVVRITKQATGDCVAHQVTNDLFPAHGDQVEREQLQTVARFHPTVNELFFAKQVVLCEEFSAIAAIERCASLLGLFTRHQRLHREVSFIDCDGKQNIPAFQRVLNAFQIPYRVLHDVDTHNPAAFADNERIATLLPATPGHVIYGIGPDDLEGMLGHFVSKRASKPFAAVRRIEELHAASAIPQVFVEAVNMAYFGLLAEPAPS